MGDMGHHHFLIGEWAIFNSGMAHLVGREMAELLRGDIAAHVWTIAEGEVLTLDCRHLEHFDVTAADECFVKLMRRLCGMEFGDRYLILLGLTPTQEENLQIALERHKMAMAIQRQTGPDIIGALNPYLSEAFAYVKASPQLSARKMADARQMGLSLAGTKLGQLWQLRLTQRRKERLRGGGMQYFYQIVQSSVRDGI